MKILKAPQRFMRSDELATVSEFTGYTLTQIMSMPTEQFWKVLCKIHGVSHSVEISNRFKDLKMANDDLVMTTFVKYVKEFDFEVMCLGDKVSVSQKRLVKFFIKGLRPKPLAETVEFQLPDTIADAKRLTKSALPELRFAREQAKRFSESEAKSGDHFKRSHQQDKTKVYHKPLHNHQSSNAQNNYKAQSTEDKKKRDLSEVVCYVCGQKGHYASKHSKEGGKTTAKMSKVVGEPEKKLTLLEVNPSDISSDSVSVDGLFRVAAEVSMCRLGAVEVSGMVFCDTGANVNTIDPLLVQRLIEVDKEIKVKKDPSFSVKLGGKDIFLKGVSDFVELQVVLNCNSYKLYTFEKLYLVETGEDIIYGLDALRRSGLLRYMDHGEIPTEKECPEEDFVQAHEASGLFSTIQSMQAEQSNDPLDQIKINPEFPQLQELQDLIKKYSHLFSPFDGVGMKVPPVSFELKPGARLTCQPVRYVNPKMMPKLESELNRLEREGISYRVLESDHAAPLVIAPKPDGNIRLAVDYREFNEACVAHAGTIPANKLMFPVLAGKKFYAKMDNLWGFNQLPVHENSKHLLVINTPFGMYSYNFLPFGVSKGPAVYQDRMQNIVLKDLFMKTAVVFIDDTTTFGDAPSDFLKNLEAVFKRFDYYNVKLKPSKCKFGFSEVEFLGHIFNEQGYRLSEERKQGIRDMPIPINLKQLRSFLGMINFFRDFIPNLSEMLIPLTDLTATSKRAIYVWTAQAQVAFDRVKEAVMKASSLFFVEEGGELILYTDASTRGIGSVLIQKCDDGSQRPISFLSMKFSEAAQKWSTIEQECFAVFYSIIQLQPHLQGRRFYVATDHRNLIYMQQSTVPKIVRWRLRLLEFDYVVKHIPGKDNVVADALSRILKLVQIGDESLDSVEILGRIHNTTVGHHGINRTLDILKESGVSWKNMSAEVSKFIKNCPICQKVKPQRQSEYDLEVHTLSSDYPMQSLSIDSLGPFVKDSDGNQYILNIICNMSKYSDLYATKSVTALEYAHAMVKHVSIYGLPLKVRTDRGTQFTAEVSQQLAKLLNYQHNLILTDLPSANGLVERPNAEILKHLRAIVMDKRCLENWSINLPLVQRILNGAVNRSIGVYPSKLIFPHLPVQGPLLVVGSQLPAMGTVSEFCTQLIDRANSVIEASLQYLTHSNNNARAKGSGKSTTRVPFLVGDFVLATYSQQSPHKLAPVNRGPLQVVEKVGENILKCQDIITGKVLEMHVNRLLPFRFEGSPEMDHFKSLAASDKDEYVVDSIIDHTGDPKKRSSLRFRVRWLGFDESEATWLPYRAVKDLEALDVYISKFPMFQGLIL
jgi:RNase H-like domain found in reverse transcriptase/Reverse transcriptase (RNA-dependent DNA polymerase)/Integrase zinc binding domain